MYCEDKSLHQRFYVKTLALYLVICKTEQF